MAQITVSIPRDRDWPADARARLMIGSEGAASLAASSPSGGTHVMDVNVWPAAGRLRGGWGAPGTVWGATLISWGQLGQVAGWADPATAWGGGAWGVTMPGELVMVYRYWPTDKTATLPVGVVVADAAGNVSGAVEAVVTLDDAPRGVTDMAIAAGSADNQADLTWTLSNDVET